MSITDELRDWVSNHYSGWPSKQAEGYAIANRIDAEHERVEQDLIDANNQMEQLCECSIKLPVDADGEPIHIGDVMENIVHPPTHREVTGVGVECFYAWEDGCGRYSQFDANRYRHYHAPTVEDVLRDMHMELDEVTALYVGEAIDSDERDRDEARIFAKYASKLRLAGEDA